LQLIVDRENQYRRLDKFLRNQLTNVPLSEIYKFIRTGKVLVNDRPVKKASYEIDPGDKIDLLVDLSLYKKKRKELSAVPLKLDILYEDDNLLVLNKKPGISLHPSERTKGTTLIQGLLFYGDRHGFQPYLVHRLDRDTSGILVVAKNLRVCRILSRMFKERFVEKEYIALVSGSLQGHGVINTPLDGLESLTEYTVIENFQDSTLVSVLLHTGRTHQIRRHFSSIGKPVIGDMLYGDKTINKLYRERFGLRRQFLHCIRISFADPSQPRRLQIKAPLSEDLEEVLRGLRR